MLKLPTFRLFLLSKNQTQNCIIFLEAAKKGQPTKLDFFFEQVFVGTINGIAQTLSMDKNGTFIRWIKFDCSCWGWSMMLLKNKLHSFQFAHNFDFHISFCILSNYPSWTIQILGTSFDFCRIANDMYVKKYNKYFHNSMVGKYDFLRMDSFPS